MSPRAQSTAFLRISNDITMDTLSNRESSNRTCPRTSQLCKPLSAILKDSGTLSVLDYFIQFMESEGALHLLQFWFAVESFKNAISSPRHRDHLSPSTATHSPSTYCAANHELVCLNTSATYHKQCDTVSTQVGGSHTHMTTVGGTQVTNEEKCVNSKNCTLPCADVAAIPDSMLLSSPLRSHVDGGVPLQLHEENKVCGHHEGRMLTHASCNSTSLNGQTAQQPPSETSANGTQVHRGFLKQLSLNTPSVDALSIYTTYVALNALHRVNIPDNLRQEIEVNICPEDGKVDRNCFNRAQAFVYGALEGRYYPGFLSSHQLCNYQFEYISSGKLTLLDFLLGDNALFYFMEYMEQESCSSLIQFWLTAESFTNELSSPQHVPDTENDTRDAIAIYERYFSLQAANPLHFGDTIRMDIENKICDEHGPRKDSFVTAQEHAYQLMNEFHFPGFLKSSVYLRFLNELVVTINKPAPGQTSLNAPALPAAPEPELSTDCPCGSRWLENLDDPDSLWWRPPAVLRLGYVDKFGQYISEIEAIPTKPLRQRGDTSKKFLWLRKTRNEEEIAMKIARTIIMDVLNVHRTE